MTVLVKFDAKADFSGQCVSGPQLLMRASDLLMNSDLDYMAAFQAAKVQMCMANKLSGWQKVAEAEPPTVGGKSGGLARG